MLLEILCSQTPDENKKLNKPVFYCFNLEKEKLFIQSPYDFEEEKLWKLLFGLKNIEKINSYQFKKPLKRGNLIIEEQSYLWILKRLSGLKNLPPSKALPFIYSRLYHNYFSVLNFEKHLSNEQISQMLHYMLSNSLFSFQMLFVLFQLLEEKLPLSPYISRRAFKEFEDEVAPIKDALKEDKSFKVFSIFLSNYYYQQFLRDENILPEYSGFLKQLRSHVAQEFFNKINLIQIIRKMVEEKEISRFLGSIDDNILSRAFNTNEWNEYKKLISSRSFKRIKEDIQSNYTDIESAFYKLSIVSKSLFYFINKKPPFFFLNKAFEMKSELNIIFDHSKPFNQAIFFSENSQLKNDLLPFYTPFRRGFIENYLNGKITKRGGVSDKEKQKAGSLMNFYVAAKRIFPNIWYLLDFE